MTKLGRQWRREKRVESTMGKKENERMHRQRKRVREKAMKLCCEPDIFL